MRWEKLGMLFAPAGAHPKLLTHAANPLPVLLEGDIYRVFFSGRDAANRSSVGCVDIDVVRRAIVRDHVLPAFEFGPAGSFYSHGVSIGNCYEVGGVRYMLFMGWQCPPDGHWRGDIGRLRLDDDCSLHLDRDVPFLGTDIVDPLSLSYPWVMQQPNGGYRMWYGSTIAWDAGNGEMLHVIQHADSADGHVWKRKGQAIPHQIGVAQAFSRPTVAVDPAGGYHMWFSYRGAPGRGYRIGHAESSDAEAWELELAGASLDTSEHGWDSEMVEYPFVFEHRGQTLMLYNGNDYGKSGFGIAVLEE